MSFITDRGQVLLNPQEKRNKAFMELKQGIHLTNVGSVKLGSDGKKQKLTESQRAYRAGYIAAQNDSAKAFRSKHPQYKSKRK